MQRKLFKGGNYSRAETVWGSMVFIFTWLGIIIWLMGLVPNCFNDLWTALWTRKASATQIKADPVNKYFLQPISIGEKFSKFSKERLLFWFVLNIVIHQTLIINWKRYLNPILVYVLWYVSSEHLRAYLCLLLKPL